MHWANSQFFWFLGIIPLLIFFYLWSFRRKRELIERFVSSDLQERLLTGFSPFRQKLKVFLLLLAFFFAVLSLMRPQWGFHWEEIKRRGVDMVVALDVSKSMLAEDVSPNRLLRAKREIVDLLNIMEGDRIGVVAFAGTSFLQVPLTLDYGAVRIFLDDIDTDLIPVPGTAIAEAILKSLQSFDRQDKKSRVVILITDGEDHQGDPIKAAEKAKQEGVKIYTVGIGQNSGAPIPDAKGGFKKDSRGEVILSKLDEETLQRIANLTGGRYIRSHSGNLDLEKIYQDIQKTVEDKELKSGKRKRFEERFQWPLMVAIILLLIEAMLSERRRRIKDSLMVLLLLFSLGSSDSLWAWSLFSKEDKAISAYKQKKYNEALQNFIDQQVESPNDLRLKYNLANTYYQAKDYDKATQLYGSIVKDSQDAGLQEKAYYNLGNTLYQQGKLKESVEAYREALKIDPNDKDAQHNLNFVLEEIKRRVEEQKKQQQQQQNQEQQDQNGQQQQQEGAEQKQKSGEQKKEEAQKQEGQMKEGKDKEKEKQSAQASAEDKEKKEDKKKQDGSAKQQSAGRPYKEGEMTPEEARRWLSTLEENRKKYLRRQLPSGQRYQVEKDW